MDSTVLAFFEHLDGFCPIKTVKVQKRRSVLYRIRSVVLYDGNPDRIWNVFYPMYCVSHQFWTWTIGEPTIIRVSGVNIRQSARGAHQSSSLIPIFTFQSYPKHQVFNIQRISLGFRRPRLRLYFLCVMSSTQKKSSNGENEEPEHFGRAPSMSQSCRVLK